MKKPKPEETLTRPDGKSAKIPQCFSDDTNRIIDDDIPQAFSHWTSQYTQGEFLVCDLQGVVGTKCFSFTDPAIHSKNKGKFGLTDHGIDGQKNFFRTHECNPLCRILGLR